MSNITEPGSTIGRYRVVSKIGSGGMGEVYLATDTELDRLVALKVLRTATANDSEAESRFVREAKAASALNHPNILTVHEIGTFEDSRFIATEYIKGETLRAKLEGESPNLRETLEIILQVAAALEASHNAGIVHRDIKPENIMLRDDGLAKVLDFGLAKLSQPENGSFDANDATQFETKPGMFMGTPHYMSPEQARAGAVDARSDVWSTGVVFYEMLTTKRPFRGETLPDIIAAILTKDPDLLDETIPSELQRILRKSLEKKSDERYQTIKDFLIDIKNLKRELEFSEDLKRSHIPTFSKSANVTVTESSENATVLNAAANSTQNSISLQPSSAEYIVSGFLQHKRVTLAVLGMVLLACIGAASYLFWFALPAKAAIKSVAVLPFANASGDAEQDYLSDGISEAVINRLSELKGLKVIARGSAFKYKGKEIDLDEVARTLGVETVVTGRVVRRGDHLQISAELVKVGDKSQLWGETFSRMAAGASGLEAEISKRIAESLRQKLTNAEERQIAKGANVNPQAYDLYLRGRFFFTKSGNITESCQKAIDLYDQAIAIEPNYALAYVGVAESYRFLVGDSLIEPKVGAPKIDAALKKAFEIDDSLADAYAISGLVKMDNWSWAEAEGAFKRSIELNPNLYIAYSGYGNLLSLLGRHDESIANSQKARDLDPANLSSSRGLAVSFYWARRYDESIELLTKTLELDQEQSVAHVFRAYAHAAKGNYDQAIADYKEDFRIDGESTSTKCYLGAVLSRSGRRDEARSILRELENTKEYVSPAELTVLYTALNEKEKAFAALERSFSVHDLQMGTLVVEPGYDDLRPDPRFQDLLRRVGLSK